VGRLDEARLSGAITESLPNFSDVSLQHAVADMQVAPEAGDQVLFRDQLSRVLDQVAQERKSSRLDRDELIPAP
jgi:hypothetical protein